MLRAYRSITVIGVLFEDCIDCNSIYHIEQDHASPAAVFILSKLKPSSSCYVQTQVAVVEEQQLVHLQGYHMVSNKQWCKPIYVLADKV